MFIKKSQKINYQNCKSKEFEIEHSKDKYFQMLETRAKMNLPAKITHEQIKAATKIYLANGGKINRRYSLSKDRQRADTNIPARRSSQAYGISPGLTDKTQE